MKSINYEFKIISKLIKNTNNLKKIRVKFSFLVTKIVMTECLLGKVII